MHRAIGRLRGKAEPREDILDRLLVINPNYRVYWALPTPRRPGYWEIHEHRPNPARAAAGHHRLRRWEEMERKAITVADKARINFGIPRDCESMIDQVHYVAAYTDEQFGQDFMFVELREGEQNLRAVLAQMEREYQKQEAGEVLEEADEDPAFDQYLRDVCTDYYEYVCLGSVTRSKPEPKIVPPAPDVPAPQPLVSSDA